MLVTYLNNIKMAELQEEKSRIQISINNLLILNNESNYSEIDELLPYLPNYFNEAQIYNELELVKNLADINDPSVYTIDFDSNSTSPFDTNINDNLNFVKISITMNIDDYTKIFDYIDTLNGLDHLYYIDSLRLSILNETSSNVSIVLYTYYMN